MKTNLKIWGTTVVCFMLWPMVSIISCIFSPVGAFLVFRIVMLASGIDQFVWWHGACYQCHWQMDNRHYDSVVFWIAFFYTNQLAILPWNNLFFGIFVFCFFLPYQCPSVWYSVSLFGWAWLKFGKLNNIKQAKD